MSFVLAAVAMTVEKEKVQQWTTTTTKQWERRKTTTKIDFQPTATFSSQATPPPRKTLCIVTVE